MNLLYEFSKQILRNIDAWKNFPAIDEEAGDRWHLETLFRLPPFQVEKVTIAPETHVSDHCHPNVNSFEIYVEGTFYLRVKGRLFKAHPDLKPHRRMIPIVAGVVHGGTFYHGGVFLSVQQWHDGNPRHISEDWVGIRPEKTFSSLMAHGHRLDSPL